VQLFDISPLADQLTLDDKGGGETTFTVTNAAARALRARIRIAPQAPAEASWFTVEGEAERSFAPGAAHQFLVRLQVPAGTPAGPIRFRADAVSVENPDEDFTIGPTVGAEVRVATPPPPPPPPPPRWWIWLIVAGAVLLIVIGVVLWLISGNGVPDLTGMSREEAVATLEEEGLALGVVTQEPSKEPHDTVLRTKPEAGEDIEEGSAVDLVLSLRRVAVPPCDEREASIVVDHVVGRHLVPVPQLQAGAGRSGFVIRCEPAENTEVEIGTKVRVIVRGGPGTPLPKAKLKRVPQAKPSAPGNLRIDE